MLAVLRKGMLSYEIYLTILSVSLSVYASINTDQTPRAFNEVIDL